MAEPITVEIPHKLGREGARTRMAGGIGNLAGMIPGGAVVAHHWNGDTLEFSVQALGQTIASRCAVEDDKVVATIDLPPLLALFADKLRAKLQKEAPKLLE